MNISNRVFCVSSKRTFITTRGGRRGEKGSTAGGHYPVK